MLDASPNLYKALFILALLIVAIFLGGIFGISIFSVLNFYTTMLTGFILIGLEIGYIVYTIKIKKLMSDDGVQDLEKCKNLTAKKESMFLDFMIFGVVAVIVSLGTDVLTAMLVFSIAALGVLLDSIINGYKKCTSRISCLIAMAIVAAMLIGFAPTGVGTCQSCGR
ncbi:MAG: hypothetical protein Q4C54_09170 [Clostridia bacterium]|nr:hypothetical protein [Clostridia bacterium]